MGANAGNAGGGIVSCCQNQSGSLHLSQDLLAHLLTVPGTYTIVFCSLGRISLQLPL